jgi:alkanesulfonate monooxygenase SsuD/methylene tetrahydromethanopterin reductase-like flavin-dependent oxidoreductase (luciferase family)
MSFKLGVTLPQFTDDRSKFVDGARRAEDCGLDSVWLFDHLWPLSGGKDRPIIECWTALAWLAAATERVQIGTLVTRSSLRHPALLAKMAATVGEIAPGRVIVTIGSGDDMSRPENDAYGLPFYGPDDRSQQLLSVVGAVRNFLTADELDVHDKFVDVTHLPPSPRPENRPAVWVGGRSGDVLEAAGLIADGWNGWGGGPKRFARDAQIVLDTAEGRPVELSWGGQVLLSGDDKGAEAKLGSRDARQFVVGGPETVAGKLRALVDTGATHLVCAFPDAGESGNYELLQERVRPAM